MHAHQPMAPLPVDDRFDLLAGFGQRARAVRRHMHHRAVLAVDRRGDCDFAAVAGPNPASVARLAAAGRVEHGALQPDAAVLRNADDAGPALARIGVLAKDLRLAHEPAFWLTNSPARFLSPASSQAGTGSPFAARNAGLNSLV